MRRDPIQNRAIVSSVVQVFVVQVFVVESVVVHNDVVSDAKPLLSDARRTVFGRKMPRDVIAPSCAVYSSSGAI